LQNANDSLSYAIGVSIATDFKKQGLDDVNIEAIAKAMSEGKIVLSNRFSGSNMAHQGTKFSHPEERRGYFIWLDNLEYQMLGIPRPTFSFVLRVDPDTIKTLLDKRADEDANHKTDIHEANLSHLERAVSVYDDLCTLFPKDFVRIDCVRGKKLLEIDQINDLLWQYLQTHLPQPRTNKGSITRGERVHEEYVDKSNPYGATMTAAGRKLLEEAVTNVDDNVYAFNDKMSPITIAAAMARLSRRADDMRVTILDEFADAATKKDEKLLRRVITAYG
ncbi:MAG: hypothetical protein GY954_03680, partial [Alteromonas sp.]|nr:hypothetical protein [Alteromonas sp.]